jgi:hypothetical protein
VLAAIGAVAIAAPGREPVNIVAGEAFLLEVLGERRLKRVRMMRHDGKWRAGLSTAIERRVELREGAAWPSSSTSASGTRGSSNSMRWTSMT